MLEGTSGHLWVQTPAKMLDEVTQWFIQLSLEKSQGWRCTASLGNLAHCLAVPVVKVSTIHSEPLSFQFMPVTSCPSTVCHCQKPGFISLRTNLYPFRSVGRSSLKLFLQRLSKPGSFSLSSKGKCFGSNHLGGDLINLLKFINIINICLVLEGAWGLTSFEKRKIITSLDSMALLLFICVEFHEISVGLILETVQVPGDGSLTLEHINFPPALWCLMT